MMSRFHQRFYGRALLLLLFISRAVLSMTGARAESGSPPPLNWQTPVRLKRGLKKVPGTLSIDDQGVRFRVTQGQAEGLARYWPFVEIQTFDLLTARRLVLTEYENRGWRRPGDRRFRFDLTNPVPPLVAAELAQRVAKPSRNGDPLPRVPSFATLRARHHTHGGGSNGTLRFREDGIDYITQTDGENRSWRWADIQMLASPDAYHLRVVGYRENFEFTLKQPLSPELFDRLWDRVYARDLRVSPGTGGMQ